MIWKVDHHDHDMNMMTIRPREALQGVEAANRPQSQPPQDQDLSQLYDDAFDPSHNDNYTDDYILVSISMAVVPNDSDNDHDHHENDNYN